MSEDRFYCLPFAELVDCSGKAVRSKFATWCGALVGKVCYALEVDLDNALCPEETLHSGINFAFSENTPRHPTLSPPDEVSLVIPVAR